MLLQSRGGGGLTIIEALEEEISERRVGFGIVLLTPDDIGYSKSEDPENAKPRARQNVVLELGMVIVALGRPNVAILRKGFLKDPSDAQGIIYIPFNDHVRETVPKLVQRLQRSGFNLDQNA